MECGGHLAGRGTLAGMCSSLTRVGVHWLLCGVTLPGVGGTLVGVGGMLVGVKVPWLAQGCPGWWVQLPGLCVGGCPGCYGGETLSGMWGAPWLACQCPPPTREDKVGSGEEQYFAPGRSISVGRGGCRQGLALGSLSFPRGQQPPPPSKGIEELLEPRGAHWGRRVGGARECLGHRGERRRPRPPPSPGQTPTCQRPQVWAQLDVCEPHLLFVIQGRRSSWLVHG